MKPQRFHTGIAKPVGAAIQAERRSHSGHRRAQGRWSSARASLGRVLFMLLLGLGWGAGAQEFSLDWWTLSGGGGASVGNHFVLTASIGQPAAGTMGGGGYQMASGFGAVALALQPAMRITFGANQTLIIAWPKSVVGFELLESGNLNLPAWNRVEATPVAVGDTWQVTLPAPAGNMRFYRLRQ